MATAYTPILKLALPVTGELAGTWGTVVNDNITSMVEQAVAGLATINTWVANSHTLTTADGTTSESRCAMLVIDDDGAGNPSAAATVICPTATKSYIVRNLCGQTVTVKTSAGTGVAVPNNQAALVFCDGTNVVTGAFNGDVVGPSTATNTAVAIFDGTTGKLIKNTGVTIDGSNNVSGVVQLNATTLDATNIEVTNLKAKDGTAAGSIADSTGVVTLTTLAGTTANITTVNATTVDTTNLEVTNLKAKDGTAAGSIADSTGVVTLASSVLTTTDINGGTIDGAVIGGSTAAAGTFTALTDSGNLTFTGTGNRILGDFSNATDANRVAFQTSTTNSITRLNIISNGTGTASSLDVFGVSDPTNAAVMRIRQSGSESQIQASITGTGTYLPMTFYTGGSERVRIDTSGNVGIGTNSPSANLHVANTANTGTSADTATLIVSSTNRTAALTLNGNATNFGTIVFQNAGSESGRIIYSNASNYMAFQTNGTTERMRIDSSGNLNYGITGSSTYALRQVYMPTNGGTAILGSAAYHTTNAYFDGAWKATATGGSAQYLQANNVHTWSNAASVAANAAVTWAESMRIDSSGNVGIGTSSPNGRLHVTGGTTNASNLATAYSAAAFTLTPKSTSGYSLAFGSGPGDLPYIQMSAAGTVTEAMLLQPYGGSVGIGTTSPQAKLTVSASGASGLEFFANAFGGGVGTYIQSFNRSTSAYVNTGYYANAHTFWANGSDRMVIDSSGNVGIGTASPDNALTIQDAGAGVNKRFSIRNGDSTNNHKLTMGYNAGSLSGFIPANATFILGETNGGYGALAALSVGTTSATPIIFGTNNTERMRIDSSGRVGIGQIPSGSEGIFNVDINGVAFHLGFGGNYDNYYTSGSSGIHVFRTANTERMRIHASGGVSIGNTTDSGDASLNVTGSVNGGYVALANGTTAMGFATKNVVRVTPTATATFTSTVPAAGAICVLSILTSGASSYTITFGSGFKSTGTLATGTTTARYFQITFVSDGTNLLEMSRTVAIA